MLYIRKAQVCIDFLESKAKDNSFDNILLVQITNDLNDALINLQD